MAIEFTRRISENGKLTVPKEIRELHGIEEGDYVRIQLVEVIPKSRVKNGNGPHLPGRES